MKHKINVESLISADSPFVWNCYTQPSHIVNWNFASDDWHCPSAENDLRVGGKYRVRMEAKDGSFGFDLEATYTEVEVDSRFVFVMADDREVSFSMSPEGNNTLVSIEFEAENMNPLETQRAGWQAILDNFKKYLESIR